jgi:hypothetical protein
MSIVWIKLLARSQPLSANAPRLPPHGRILSRSSGDTTQVEDALETDPGLASLYAQSEMFAAGCDAFQSTSLRG